MSIQKNTLVVIIVVLILFIVVGGFLYCAGNRNLIQQLQTSLLQQSKTKEVGKAEGEALVPATFAPGRLLVRFKDNVPEEKKKKMVKDWGFTVEKEIKQIKVKVISVPEQAEESLAKALSKNPNIDYVEVDGIAEALFVPNDIYYGAQWAPPKIQADYAWNITKGSPNVKIAILDTGIQMNHPDLTSKIVAATDFTNSSSSYDDVYGHGTHCAGIAAAATNNSIGVAGVCPDCSLMNVKVLADNGAGQYSWIANGIIWAADNGANVISMSLGGGGGSQVLEDAINYAWNKGVVVVAAAGNNGNNISVYPAYYTNCIAVAATDRNDVRPLFSNYGDWVDVAAPGSGIISTFVNNNYVYEAGTSMASPHVAGLAGLLFTVTNDKNSNGFKNDEVRFLIESTTDNKGQYPIANGRINAFSAVSAAGSVPPLPEPPLAPTGLTCTTISSSQIDVSWNAASGATGYRIYRCTGATCTPITLVQTQAGTSWSNTGLTSNTAYGYRVKSYNDVGESDYSNIATCTTEPTPTYTLFVQSDLAGILFQGISIQSETGHGGTTNYEKTISAETRISLTAPATSSNYEFSYWSGCISTTTRNINFSMPSSKTTCTAHYNEIYQPTSPPIPTGLTCKTISSSQIGVSWNVASGATGYRIYRCTGATCTPITLVQTQAGISWSNTGLISNATYSYRVKSYNDAGESDYSNVATCTTSPEPPPIPTGLTCTTISSSQINVSWTAASGATGYRIYRCTGATCTPITLVQTQAGISWSNTGLASYTTYRYRVKAYNISGESDYSTIVDCTTPDNIFPVVSITSPLNNSTVSGTISVNVTATDNVGVVRVELYKDGILFATDDTLPYSFAWDTTKDINGTHKLEAKAYDAANNASVSTITVTVSNVLQDTTPPTVSIVSPTNGQIVHSWGRLLIDAKATDNVKVTEIDILVDNKLITSCFNVKECFNNFALSKLKAGSHTITANAFDARNNIGKANITVIKK